MMASMTQAYSPHPAGLQHPGIGPGHPMGPGHPQPGGGQTGPGMVPQMHMGVSGPGSQVTQAGAMLGMQPGVVGPGAPSAHALQHLNPNQAQMYQQQQAAQMAYASPQMQMQQQHLMQQQVQRAQAARNALMAQQFNSGLPMGMPNGIPPQMNAAQFAAMRGGQSVRPVALTQHLQQQQQQAQLGAMAQEQAQQQAQQQQLLAQQIAIQQANAAAQAGNNAGQTNQMAPQQMQNLQNAQLAAAQHQQQQQQHQQQQQQQQQQQAAATQQAQPPGQVQPQAPQAQQSQPQTPQQQPAQQQQQQVAASAMMQRPRDQIKGHCILKLVQFGDHLSQFVATKQRDDLAYWAEFVETFFSPQGVLRHSVWDIDENTSKQYEVTFPALARYFFTHFESGIVNMQMTTEKAKEKELPNNCHYIESQKSSFIYWFDNGSQLVSNGILRAQFDANQKIALLEFVTSNHEEYVPRTRMVEAARPLHEWQKEWKKANAPPDGKQSPEMSKKKTRPTKSQPTGPPEIDIPESKVKGTMGITPSVFRFLEIAEVLGQMNPLFSYSHLHVNLRPYTALEQYVQSIPLAQAGPGMIQPGQRTPNTSQFPMGQSPSTAHLGLPENAVGGSPAQGHMQAPGMAHQRSQQGTNSSGPSANTSPNVTNKRRRPSVKTEGEDGAQANGVQAKAKPGSRIGGKRQKGSAA